jgi:hypothetical protein
MRPSLEKALVEKKKLLDEVRREMVKKIREISKDSNFDSKGNLTQEAHQEFVDFCLTQPNSGVRFYHNTSYQLIDKNRMDELFNLIEFTANNGKKYTLYFPKINKNILDDYMSKPTIENTVELNRNSINRYVTKAGDNFILNGLWEAENIEVDATRFDFDTFEQLLKQIPNIRSSNSSDLSSLLPKEPFRTPRFTPKKDDGAVV